MKSTKVWFNRAGISRVHIADQLRNNPDNEQVVVHATRPGATGAALTAADSCADEPDWDLSDKEYGDWAVEHAKDNGIDVLAPSCRMRALAARKQDFANIGCTVMTAATSEISTLLDSKTATYTFASTLRGVAVPPFRRVTSSVEFQQAVKDIQTYGFTPTVKLNSGWSADSFRILTDGWPEGEDLVLHGLRPTVNSFDYAVALRSMERKGTAFDLIVMPYMEAPEISVDVLAHPEDGVLAMVPRAKSRGRARTFDVTDDVLEMTRILAEELELTYLANVQFRYLAGKPVLLEINPRPAAGSYQSIHAGVHLHWEAVRLATGRSPRRLTALRGVKVEYGDQVFPV